MSTKAIKIVFAVVLLFAGGMIYIAFRSESLAMFTWFRALRLNGVVDGIRNSSSEIQLPYFVKYCLPNGLWITSYLIATDALVERRRLLWALALPGIAIVFEILQIWGVIPGTFDYLDLLCLIIPTLFYIICCVLRYEKGS